MAAAVDGVRRFYAAVRAAACLSGKMQVTVVPRPTSESRTTQPTVGFGLTYSNPGGYRAGGSGLPVDAGWSYERVVRSSGGIVPDRHVMRARFRVYLGVF